MKEEWILVLIVLLMAIYIVLTTSIFVYKQPPAYNNAPAYLLLNNWRNGIIYISTGIQIQNYTINGERGFNTSIQTIFFNGTMLPIKIYADYNESTEEAFLTLNNTVVIRKPGDSFQFIFPPDQNRFLILPMDGSGTFMLSFYGNISYSRHSNYTEIKYENSSIFLSPGSTIEKKSGRLYIFNSTFLEFSYENSSFIPINSLILINSKAVSNWLLSSVNVSLPKDLSDEYHLSLLLLKDDQNPLTGEFAASPEPVYMYSWVRDSSFSAMALQASGHVNSAVKYWRFLAKNDNGTFYTRYNFWNGQPDLSYGIPEYDSLGLFEMGLYNLYEQQDNRSLISQFIPALNRTSIWQENHIYMGLIPEDLSVWEDNLAYNFWTQAFNSIGLKDTAKLYYSLGLDSFPSLNASEEINRSIQKYFFVDDFYIQSLSKAAEYANGSMKTVLIPNKIVDSSAILPIVYGLISPNSTAAVGTVEKINRTLNVKGGLSRFPNDDYHYSSDLYDSSAPSPPWIITTLFLADYYEEINASGSALSLMNFVLAHSNNGLLPEALDPNTLEPLPTTSPLTWSSAMYVLTALDFKP